MTVQIFRFPHPVNEVSARLVAGGVVLLALLTLATQERWLLLLLAYGFVARVLSGPTLSPLGQLVTRLITPRLPLAPKYVSGPPKRFAQLLGAIVSVSALVLWFGFGQRGAADILLGMLTLFATLEAVFAFCLGCRIFALLMAAHVIPAQVCEACADITRRHTESRDQRPIGPGMRAG